MAGQMSKWFVLLGLLAGSLLVTEARPGFARPMPPGAVVAAGPTKHVIKAGETLNLLALRYGVPAAAILKANPGLTPTRLQLGKTIVIPVSAKAPAPAAETAPPAPSGAGDAIELRPEKAPQATHPLPQTPTATSAKPPAEEQVIVVPAARPAATAASPGTVATPTGAAVQEPATAAKAEAPSPKRPKVEDIWPPSAAAGSLDTDQLRPLVGSLWLLGLLGGAILVVAVALRGVLANGAAGIFLRLARPFQLGDTLRIGDCVGRLTARGLFALELRDADGARLLVPNARVLDGIVVVRASEGGD